MTCTIALIFSIVLIIIDQLIKKWVILSIKPLESIHVIEGLLDFTYVENFGAAYGIFKDKKWFLVIITLILLIAIIYLLISKRINNKFMIFSSSLIIGGGIGNLIDRFLYGYVVDFIDIGPLFSFPVFNFADSCIVVGTGLFVIYLMFFDDKTKKKELK
ncbi:MAG: signal peptidase II [Oscillospiraceae bacterium]